MKGIVTLTLILVTLLMAHPMFAIHGTNRPAQETQLISQTESQTLTKKNIRKESRIQRRQAWIQRMVDRSGEDEVIVAVLLAFFLGFAGIHRVYLGGNGLLVLAYLFTFGGIFGILPLIDFIRLAAGGIDHYRDNNRFFAAFE